MVKEETQKEIQCDGSHDGNHRPIRKMGSKSGYICSCCRKEVEKQESCQVCNKDKSDCKNFNEYYHACEGCL